MDEFDNPPPPTVLIDELAEIGPGLSRWFGQNYSAKSIRSTLTRLKNDGRGTFTTRPEDGGLRVWRLS